MFLFLFFLDITIHAVFMLLVNVKGCKLMELLSPKERTDTELPETSHQKFHSHFLHEPRFGTNLHNAHITTSLVALE